MENLAVLSVVGAISGLFSGLLGIGGGVIIVPALIVMLPHFGLAGPDLVKVAMATSLTTVVVTGLAGAAPHLARSAVDWVAVRRLAPGIVLGSFAGSQLSGMTDGLLLTIFFVGFLLYAAWRMLPEHRIAHPAAGRLPGLPGLSVKGFGTGIFCSMLGIGGALFLVPLLSAYISIQRSIATTSVLGIPLAVTAAASYLLADTPTATCSSGCAGYVYLAGAGAIAAATILTAPLGAYLTHVLPTGPLRMVFAACMVVIAGQMTWKTMPSVDSAAYTASLRDWLTAADTRPRPARPLWLDEASVVKQAVVAR
jgi:hypothetical protein